MLANAVGGSEPAPDKQIRREVLTVLAALGPHLLAASRAIDSPHPRHALRSLREAARVLRPFLP